MRPFLLTWAGAFLLVTLLLYALQPLLHDWPTWMRAIVISGAMVLGMRRAIAPTVARILKA